MELSAFEQATLEHQIGSYTLKKKTKKADIEKKVYHYEKCGQLSYENLGLIGHKKLNKNTYDEKNMHLYSACMY